VDLRSIAELYAKGLGVRYIIGDTVLRSAVRARLDDGSVIEYAPRSMTVQSRAKIQLIDMRPYKKDKTGNYRALSAELVAMLQDTERANNRTFILAGRRGLASSVTCGDCGTAVICSRCSTPYTLTANGEIRTQRFLCTKCGFQARTDVRCSACDSWKLMALGAGSQKIVELVQAQFPNRSIFRVDSDITKTPAAVKKVVEAYEQSTSGILVGTELVLPYLPESIPYAAVSSIDSLLAVPELGVDERVFALLMRLREMTQVSLIIQSRTPERTILLDAVNGDIEGYAVAELSRRRELAFPPFSIFVTISRSGKPTPVETAILTLMQNLATFDPIQLPQLRSRVYTARILVRVPASTWPHRELLQKLRSLDPSYSVHVGTENLFA
jgi:primosomal protein N' (replication factor Y)